MKKLALFGTILLVISLFASCDKDENQAPAPMPEKTIGLHYKDRVLDLEITHLNKSGILLITNPENVVTRKAELEQLKKNKQIHSFTFIGNNEFVIRGKNYKPKSEDYYSFFYTEKGRAESDYIMILPLISMEIEKDYPIEKLVKTFKGKLEIKKIDESHIARLKCNVKNSNDILLLLKELKDKFGTEKRIKWWEPNMRMPFKLFE